jgi:hypothetical protein
MKESLSAGIVFEVHSAARASGLVTLESVDLDVELGI